jgi:glutamine amidotransferase
MTARVVVLDYGIGNLRSVARALEHVGGEASVTGDAGEIARADALVIPGVGHVGACLRALRERDLVRPVLAFVGGGRPVVGVCVGMQLLFERSEESDDDGLALLPGVVRRLPDTVKVPHMGWNSVRWTRPHPFTAGMPDDAMCYFVHSYAAGVDDRTTVGVAEHGRPFAAAVAKDYLFATQFHPEKSGETGLQLYENLVKAVVAA